MATFWKNLLGAVRGIGPKFGLMLTATLVTVLLACQGAPGATGPEGLQGQKGEPGLAGAVGLQGEQGLSGLQGPIGGVGPQGATGQAGERGASGPKGDSGEQGGVGLQGPAGPRGPQGPAGIPGVSIESITTPVSSSRPVSVLTGASIDTHTSLLSPIAGAAITGSTVEPSTAEDLIGRLDEAIIDKAVVLSRAFSLPSEGGVRSENRFVSAEVGKYPDRLFGFCGINPVLGDALDEVERCLDLSGMVGVAIHLPDSDVDLQNERHLAGLNNIFDLLEVRRAPLMLQLGSATGLPLGSEERENLTQILFAHPEVRTVLAQCAGPVDDGNIELWLQVFSSQLPEIVPDNLFLEVSGCMEFFQDAPESKRETLVWRLRKWGLDRVFFGSDYLKISSGPTPIEALVTLALYPFTQEEIDQITSNNALNWLEGG